MFTLICSIYLTTSTQNYWKKLICSHLYFPVGVPPLQININLESQQQPFSSYEISLNLPIGSALTNPPETNPSAEIALELSEDSSFHISPFELTIPFIGTAISFALLFQNSKEPMEPYHVFRAFLIATCASTMWRLCFTVIKNTKLYITQGTLIWTIVFIVCLPESKANMKVTFMRTMKLQFLPPFLLTVAHMIAIGSLAIKYLFGCA